MNNPEYVPDSPSILLQTRSFKVGDGRVRAFGDEEEPTDPVIVSVDEKSGIESANNTGKPKPTSSYQRVSNYLTPFNTAIVMGVGSLVTGFGTGLAYHQAQHGEYFGAQFVTGVLVGTAGLITAVPSAIRWQRSQTPECTSSTCGRATEWTARSISTTLALGMAGFVGYLGGSFVRIVADDPPPL